MFAKMMTSATGGIRHVGMPFTMVEGERIEFFYDELGRPFMSVWKAGKFEKMKVFGDVYLMTDTGQSLPSPFRPPLNFVGRNADGWKSLDATPAAGRGN